MNDERKMISDEEESNERATGIWMLSKKAVHGKRLIPEQLN
jgi:hypothetical protein